MFKAVRPALFLIQGFPTSRIQFVVRIMTLYFQFIWASSFKILIYVTSLT
jgi:hypothetical protein